VTNSVTGDPLSNVVVTIGDKADSSSSTGVYNLSSIEVGSRSITATLSGYQNYTNTVSIQKGITTSHNISLVPVATTNNSPTADAGTNQNVTSGQTVNLDGSASTDDGTINSYEWVQTSTGITLTLTNANNATASFTAPNVQSSETITL
jgi:hypothetical protein